MLTPVLLLVFAIFVAVFSATRKSSRFPLPPGPKGYPLIGNLFDLGGLLEYTLFPKTRARWGDFTSLTAFGVTIATVHTYEKAVELLDKNGHIHSSRPTVNMLELGGLENHVTQLPYGDQLRDCRKILRSEVNHVNTKSFNKIQEAATLRLLRSLLESPEEFYDHIEWYGASIILKVVYGYDTMTKNDPFIAISNQFLADIATSIKPGYLVEVFHWLRYLPSWFPFAGFKKTAAKMRKNYIRLLEEPFKSAATQLDADREENNFVARRLKEITTDRELLYLKESALIFFAAGAETTISVLLSFIFRMQDHPDIQKRAQAELDKVVGPDRLPSFDDRVNLPYIEALCKELLRHNCPVPAGLPHKSISDDIHDGYYLPKGTITFASIWEMSRDPSVYKDPETFNPSRFLGPNPERDPALYVFGFGRRVCLGIPLAQNTIFIVVTMMLACFDFSPSLSEKAKMRYTQKLVNHPLPFPCKITPRSGVDVVRLVEG